MVIAPEYSNAAGRQGCVAEVAAMALLPNPELSCKIRSSMFGTTASMLESGTGDRRDRYPDDLMNPGVNRLPERRRPLLIGLRNLVA